MQLEINQHTVNLNALEPWGSELIQLNSTFVDLAARVTAAESAQGADNSPVHRAKLQTETQKYITAMKRFQKVSRVAFHGQHTHSVLRYEYRCFDQPHLVSLKCFRHDGNAVRCCQCQHAAGDRLLFSVLQLVAVACECSHTKFTVA